MSLFVLSFLAGILSVLAPCVLPVLPVILGSSLGTQKRYRPLVIVLSTAFFISLFTVILKVSTAFIDIPQSFWVTFSAIIIIVYGLTLVRPILREKISEKLGLYKANSLAQKAKEKGGIWGDVLLGASLGPIFASCSPTYALLLSVVFPKSIIAGIFYTVTYSLGFATLLLVFAYGGRAIIKKFSRAANPHGGFKKGLGVLLMITGVLIVTGYIKKLEVKLLEAGVFDVAKIEQRLLEDIPMDSPSQTELRPGGELLNNSQQGNSSGMSPDTGIAQNIDMIDQNTEGHAQANEEGKSLLNENYPAPEFAGLQNWINGGNYSSVKALEGKVVVVDFWTYSCINCIRTLDALKKLDATYASKGLVIIGVHAPEFQFEKDINNVKNAVEEYGLKYPVVQDNDFQTRRNYNNRFWPAKYIIDKKGNVRFTHFGEGGYEETEKVIQYLLGIDADTVVSDTASHYAQQQSPETYLGGLRADRTMGGVTATSTPNAWWVNGNWSQQPEFTYLKTTTGSIFMNIYATEANLVLGNPDSTTKATVYVDGKEYTSFDVHENKLYNVWKGDTYSSHRIEIRFEGTGVQAYAFTFG